MMPLKTCCRMMNGDKNLITVAIYTHPEFYPPLLNAIDELSGDFDELRVVTRNLYVSRWKYPDNVQLIYSGQAVEINASEKASTGWKIKSFLDFTRALHR